MPFTCDMRRQKEYGCPTLYGVVNYAKGSLCIYSWVMTNEKPRIIGYVRVSTDKQDIGPEVQIDALREEAARMGWELT
ncbi:MAG TPA: recombinase family protein, partial [Chloroflexota bacterium]|nr:recombinase family protein [Chloroflexota bacterium]